MRINSIEFHDKARDWRLENTTFDDFTLLVGASGVGKTQILRAIISIQRIAFSRNYASSRFISSVDWKINFNVSQTEQYIWSGSFNEDAEIHSEELILNGREILKRTAEEIIFQGEKTPRFSSRASVLTVIEEEPLIMPILSGFNKVIYSEYATKMLKGFSFNYSNYEEISSVTTTDEILERYMDTELKMLSGYKTQHSTFTKIKDIFINIFPQIEDVKIELEDDNNQKRSRPKSLSLRDRPILQIKEKKINTWIPEQNISSGMLRTFWHLCEILLAPNGSVILIDEFENSLGVNCIGALTEEILNAGRDLQFIITSHHPYIINNVDMQYWKVVTRNGSVVRTHTAEELKLGKSKHKAFTELANRLEFTSGLEEEFA